MTTAEGVRRRRSTGGTLAVLAVTVIENPLARRVRRTKVGCMLRATPGADRAWRKLTDLYAKQTPRANSLGERAPSRRRQRRGALPVRSWSPRS